MKIAVIGAGYWGKNLIRNFYELGYLGGICDSNPLLKAAYQEKYPRIPFYRDIDTVLDLEDIQGIVIATPAVTHYGLTLRALLAGKHVFVEKPLALRVNDAKTLVSTAEENSRILMVGHILQYHAAVIRLKQLIDDGELGKIQYLYSNRLNMGKIRTEENILWSFAPHDISVILMLLGEFPKTIMTGGGSYLQEDIADTTLTTMTFAGKVKAHIFVSWLHPFKEQKLVVVGDKKMAVFDDNSADKLTLFPHTIRWQKRVPVASKAEAETVPVEMTEPLKTECRHFITCIEHNEQPRTDGREGLRVLKVMNASQESLDNQSRMIYLDQNGNGLKHLEKKADKDTGPEYFIHETSCVDKGAIIGEGTKIWHFSHILSGTTVGRNCRIGQNVVIGPDVVVGSNCKVQNNVSVYKGVTLESNVFCGPSAVFTNVFNPRSEIARMNELRPTLVKQGATLGANCTIVCGNTIGAYAFVGAGAVVTCDVPDYAMMVGNPAEFHGWMCSCGIKLDFYNDIATCTSCGAEFENHGNRIRKL